MGKLADFVSGAGPLKKAAGTPAPAAPKVNTPAGIDVASEAAKVAAQKKAAAKGAPPPKSK